MEPQARTVVRVDGVSRMRIDEKRKVIEVLLCADNVFGQRIFNISETNTEQNACYSAFEKAGRDIWRHQLNLGLDEYWYTATEAAYRLIESSPTLRREWFGR